MPQIPTYERQVLPRGELNTRATAEDFGAGVGRALGQVGQGVSQVNQALIEKRERDAQLENERVLADARLTWTKRFQEFKLSAPEGAPDFTQNFLDSYDEWQTEALNQAQTPTARANLQAAFTDLRSQFGQKAVAFEAEEKAVARVNNVLRITDDNMNAVRADPSQYQDALAQVTRMVDGLEGVSGSDKAELKRDVVANISFGTVMGEIDGAIAQKSVPQLRAIEQDLMESKTWKEDLDSARYAQALNRARRAIAQLNASQQQVVLEGLKDAIPEMEAGIALEQRAEWHTRIDEVIEDPKEREQLHARVDRAADLGGAVNAVEAATPEEVRALMAEAQAAVETRGEFRLDVHDMNTLQKAWALRQESLKQDRASYAINTSEAARTAWQRVEDENTPEATAEYAAEVTAEQRRLGLLPEEVRLLPQQTSAALGGALNDVERTPEGAEQAMQIIQDLQRQWGGYWPKVQQQLIEDEVLTGAMAVAAGMTDPTQRVYAQSLMRAAVVGEKELKKQIDNPPPETQVQADVVQALADLKATLDYQIGGDQAYRNHADAVRTLAVYYASRGAGWSDAIDRAAKHVVNDNYIFAGTYRVPSDVPEARLVPRGATVVKRNLAAADFLPPESMAGLPPEDAKSAAARVLEEDGVWLTNADETGLVLAFPERDGSYTLVEQEVGGEILPFGYTWEELAEIGRGNPAPYSGGRPFERYGSQAR